MSAADHYAEAERLLAAIADIDIVSTLDKWDTQIVAELAQAHATLALVALQADALAVAAAGSSTLHGVIDVRAIVARARAVAGGPA